MADNKELSLHFFQNDPLEALLIKDSSNDSVMINTAFKKMFNIPDVKTFNEVLSNISLKEKYEKSIHERISSKDNSLSDKPVEVRDKDRHFRLYFFYNADEDINIIHARDLAEIDMISSQMSEYAEGLIKNTVDLEMSQREVEKQNIELQDELKARELAQNLLRQSLDNQKNIIDEMIYTLSLIGIIKDPYTGMHQQRVATLSKAIAEEMELDEEQVYGIYNAGMLHDIGKISIPSEILSKPGKISTVEMKLIRTHPKVSREILKPIDFPWPVARIAFEHHERIDGTGYPEGISGKDILLEAKIISVADVVEAITSHRPYREGLGIDVALDEITTNKGTKYESEIVDTCIMLFQEKNFTFDDK